MASYYFLQYFNIFLNKILQCYQMIEILDYIILPGFSKNFFLEQGLIKKNHTKTFLYLLKMFLHLTNSYLRCTQMSNFLFLYKEIKILNVKRVSKYCSGLIININYMLKTVLKYCNKSMIYSSLLNAI